jgi:deazaflavin-dependent oxidoreductase (nitroreductase family)
MEESKVSQESTSSFRFMNRFINPVVRLLLRSPLHGLLSASLLLLTYQGRKSGQAYTLPVQYVQSGQTFYIVVGMAGQKRWWRNLIGGAPVRLQVRGKELPATAEAISGDQGGEDVVDGLLAYVSKFPSAARSRKVQRSPDGGFDREQVRAAAAEMVIVRAKGTNA